jgi:hypothetical protein
MAAESARQPEDKPPTEAEALAPVYELIRSIAQRIRAERAARSASGDEGQRAS